MDVIVEFLWYIVVHSVYYTIRAFITWLRWHRKVIYPAEVGDLIFTEKDGRNNYKYTFLFYIGTGENRIKTTYSEEAESLARIRMPKGTQTEVYYDPKKDPGHRYCVRPPVIADLKLMPIIFLACIALFAILIKLSLWIIPLFQIK